ncbi:SPOR domain-containing protein [Rhodoferax sp.]|uniref:SPOR domain-containing protein n=1 Tax=Rhodoferax sp. TaxID=50421 RepID=UPI002635109A|nr:SPOR domain-containing protein [Rhodoferax sp.]MDD5480959.1 SPOR domain-containing protein [Rhodoferax sp.]
MNIWLNKSQRGGTFLGFVLGLVVGLGAALGVAVYVTKVPVSFLNKIGGQTAEKEATEAQKNKDWDPNTPLYGKNQARPSAPAETVLPSAVPTQDPAKTAATPAKESAVAKAPPKTPAQPELKPAVSADPLGDLAKAKSNSKEAAAEPFSYFVQVGAFRTPEDAEGQRAKLSLAGVETKLSEREQAGRVVYRVRTGPYDSREVADKAKSKLDAMGIDTALVRVQR